MLTAQASDPAKIVGPNACAECHKQEVEAWKGTQHFKTFRDLPRSPEANKIADRMGLKRIKSEGVCLGCHFTVQKKSEKLEPIAGIACESCHGAAQDWIKVHSGYSGKTAQTETKAEAAARWKLAEAKGMIRPRAIYQIAKNCYGCHVVPREELVNKGAHRSGSVFDLVAWSQGEVRHNTWHAKGKENVPASPARKRMLYLVGLGVELETALRAIATATMRKIFAFEMAQRAHTARSQLATVAKALPGVPEIKRIIELGHSAGLRLNNTSALNAAADAIGKELLTLVQAYDGSTFSAIDPLIPGPDRYKGSARAAKSVN